MFQKNPNDWGSSFLDFKFYDLKITLQFFYWKRGWRIPRVQNSPLLLHAHLWRGGGGEGNLIFFYTCLPSKKQSIECKCFQLTFASSCFRLSDVIYEQLKRQLSKQFAKPCNVECMTLYFLLKHIHTSVSLAFTVGWFHFKPIHSISMLPNFS